MNAQQRSPAPRWHAALAYALLGPPARELPEPGAPWVPTLLADLGGVESVRHAVLEARLSGRWPFEVPEELRPGLGPAQFAAAWAAVQAALGPIGVTNRSVVADRALTADERRLLADRPPHHGS